MPNATLAAFVLPESSRLGLRHAFGEGEFDDLPTQREVGIAFRQGPQAVHVFGQDYPGIDMEGMASLRRPHRLAQQIDFTHQQIAAAVVQVDGKEIGRPRQTGAAVVGHGGSILEQCGGGEHWWTSFALSTLHTPHLRVGHISVGWAARPFLPWTCPGYLLRSLRLIGHWWTSFALSTLHPPHLRVGHIRRVENGEAFSTIGMSGLLA
ncbi:hypothetical protein D3C76_1161370 [compost metagenome]